MQMNARMSKPTPILGQQTADMRPFYLDDGYNVTIECADTAVSARITGLANTYVTAAIIDIESASALLPGKPVTLCLHAGAKHAPRVAGVIDTRGAARRSGQIVVELGIRLEMHPEEEPASTQDERPAPELSVRGFVEPLATSVSQLAGGEWLSFRVAGFSTAGMTLLMPVQSGVLVPGEELPVRVLLPTGQAHEVTVQVLDITRESGIDRVRARFVQKETRFLEGVSEFLLASSGYSLRDLREAGMPIGSIEKALSFSYATNERDMREVLELRLIAYQSKGKRMHVRTPEDMRDRFDSVSRQITCRIGGVLVASARVTFNDGDLNRSEYNSYGVKLPDWVIGERFVEAGRVVTHPDYRGAYIVFRLMQELARVSLQSGARYVIGSATDAVQLYERVGFRKIGLTYDAHGMKDAEVIFLDLHKVFRNLSGLDPMAWNLIALPIVDTVEERGGGRELLGHGPLKRALLLGHKLSHPLLKKASAWQQNKRQRAARNKAPA